MIPYFPKQIAIRAIIVYLLALLVISIAYIRYAMSFGYVALGILFVSGFFFLSTFLSSEWKSIDAKVYVRYLFWTAISLRLLWVIVSYFFYIKATGIPFEYGAADSYGYHGEAEWLANENWPFILDYYFGARALGISDAGYPFYLTIIYKLFGPVVIVPRFIKALVSTATCVLIYKLCSRTFCETTGRLAGIMAALMPNLIIYCGYHLKETEMIFLEVAFLERLDYLVRSRKISFWSVFLPSVLALSLFLFRTAMGLSAIFAFATSVLLSTTPSMKKGWRRLLLVGWGVLGLVVFGGGRIMTEVEGLWEGRETNASLRRYEQTSRGNQWAQYATTTVMAPMAFVLPFATMVDVSQQYGQQEKSGGNYVRNFMGFFTLLALYEAFRRKKWRDYSIIGSFVIAYLGIVAFSAFSSSERFLLPGLPCLIAMWAYGISVLRPKTYKLVLPWCIVVFAMEFAWAFFKLGSRGLF